MGTDYKQLEQLELLGKHLGELNDGLKDSSKSSNKNSRSMNFLTFALVFFAFAQVYLAWQSNNSNQKIIEIRKSCYQNVLQTNDFELNYKNCLRKNGLSD